jgi:hypothetical protein
VTADLKELQMQMPTECGWVQGYFKTFTAKNKRPYLIRWATKPEALEMYVSLKRMRQLVSNYKYCDDNSIFEGFVGKEFLWVVKKTGSKDYLRYVKVMKFPKVGTRLYVLAYRDASTFEITPEHLDLALVRSTNIRNGLEVPNDFHDPDAKHVKFQLLHINAAQVEK